MLPTTQHAEEITIFIILQLPIKHTATSFRCQIVQALSKNYNYLYPLICFPQNPQYLLK